MELIKNGIHGKWNWWKTKLSKCVFVDFFLIFNTKVWKYYVFPFDSHPKNRLMAMKVVLWRDSFCLFFHDAAAAKKKVEMRRKQCYSSKVNQSLVQMNSLSQKYTTNDISSFLSSLSSCSSLAIKMNHFNRKYCQSIINFYQARTVKNDVSTEQYDRTNATEH